MRQLEETAASAPSIDDEAVAAREDPQAICRRAAAIVPETERILIIAIGERLTPIVFALHEEPVLLWSLAHAPLLSIAGRHGGPGPHARELIPSLRAAARDELRRARLGVMSLVRCELVAASRLARA